jgi:hypothetical protein
MRSTLLSRSQDFKKEVVELEEGLTVEIRSPSIKQRNQLFKAAGMKIAKNEEDVANKLDPMELMLLAVIELTYDTTGNKLFTLADRDGLLDLPAGSWYDKVAQAAMRMLNVRSSSEEDPAKN